MQIQLEFHSQVLCLRINMDPFKNDTNFLDTRQVSNIERVTEFSSLFEQSGKDTDLYKRVGDDKDEEVPGLKTNTEKVDINETSIIRGSRPFIASLFGKPGEGKSHLAQHIVLERIKQKRVGRILIVTSTGWTDDWRFLPRKHFKRWSKSLLKRIYMAQGSKKRKPLLLILEDQGNSFNWGDPEVIKMFISHRHLDLSILVTMQYVNLMRPIEREVSSVVAIFKQTTENARKALFNSFGVNYGSKKDFYEMLEKNTGDFFFILYDARLYTWERMKLQYTDFSKTQVEVD